MKDYQKKFKVLADKQDWICPICEKTMHMSQHLSIDHKYKHNALWARRRWPYFIDSVYNLQLVHNHCNIDKRVRDNLADIEADRINELIKQGEFNECSY